jgi:hypothetical protein
MRAVRSVTKETGPAEREDQMPGVRPVSCPHGLPFGIGTRGVDVRDPAVKALLRERTLP